MATLFDEWSQSEGGFKYNALQGLKKQQATPAATKKKKGFWTDQISTGGGIGGALGGAAAGAAIGSVVPIAGTAVGGLLGALIGGGLGSAAGEAGENAIMGEDLTKNVLKEGLIGGVTSVPIGAGFKLARAGVNAGTGFGKKTAAELVQEAGMSTIGKGTVKKMLDNTIADNGKRSIDDRGLDALARLNKGKVVPTAEESGSKFSTGGRLQDMGNRALTSQYGTVSKQIAETTNPTRTIGILADAGIIKPADAERLASSITGGDGILNKAVADAVGNAGGVDTSTLRKVFMDALDNKGIVANDRKSLMTTFDAQLNRLSGGARGSITPTVNPTDALETIRAFEKRIAGLQGKGSRRSIPTPERIDQADVLKLVRDELEDQLYAGAGANANIANVLTPELRAKLINLMPNNPKWASYVDNNVMKATDVGQLRSAQSPFVNIGRIIDEGDINSMTFGGRAGNAFNNGGFKDMIGTAATNLVKEPAARVAGQSMRGLGGVGGGTTRSVNPIGQGLLGLTARQGAGRALMAEDQSQQPASLEEALLAQQTGEPVTSGVPGLYDSPSGDIDSWDPNDPTAINPPTTNPFGVSRDEVASALVRAMQANDKPAIAQLQDLYGMVSDYEDSQTQTTKMNSLTQKGLTSSANADVALQQLEEGLASAGGGSGVFMGGLASKMGDLGMNDSVSTYNDMLQSYIPTILQALGKTDAPSETELKGIIKALPQVTDSQAKAQEKLANLRMRIAAAQQNTMQYGAGVEPGLEQALLSGGY